MINVIRLTPEELGLKAVSVAAGGSVVVNGNIVPWREKWNFQTLVLHAWNDGAAPNWNVRASWIDWDKTTVRAANKNVTTGGITAQYFAYWLKDSTPRSTFASVDLNHVGVFYGAPFIRWEVINLHATNVATITLEAILFDGVAQDFIT